jgi:hypothetical protein
MVALISETLTLLERLMTRRWISLSCSLACCILLARDGKVKTSFGGPLQKKGCSM